MNRLTLAEERQRNGDAVHRFYSEVVRAFIVRLEKEFRYKQSITEEQIEEMEKIIFSKINPKNRNRDFYGHFSSYLKMRETSVKEEIKPEADPQPNCPKNKQEPASEIGVKVEEAAKVEQPQRIQSKKQEEEEQIDDLAFFDKNPSIDGPFWKELAELKSEAKAEKKTEEAEAKSCSATCQKQKEEKKENTDQSKHSSDEAQSRNSNDEAQFLQGVNQRIGSGLLGTFSSFQIKRKPKEEKIFLDIENVFVKFAHSPVENYYARISGEFSKIEKEDIKEMRK